LPTTEEDVGQNAIDREAPPSPSLAKLLQKTDTDALPCRQQHFDSGGGLLHMDAGDSWGSISKMLHQRYNSGGSSSVEPTVVTGEGSIIEWITILYMGVYGRAVFSNRVANLVLVCSLELVNDLPKTSSPKHVLYIILYAGLH